MLDKNSFLSGLFAGVIVPILGFGVLILFFEYLEEAGLTSTEGFSPMFRERTTAIVAIGLNAILLNRFNKRRFTDSVRGVVLPTFVFVGLWLFYFGKIIMP